MITGTFLDEIRHDIPHQNWGAAEWDRDFQYMKAIGIDTVILIRCGYQRFITYPSLYLMQKHHCYPPNMDLVELFLSLADKYEMQFYFGLYDSGAYWDTGNTRHEVELNKYVIEEVWQRYAHPPSFKGWYLSMEISRRTKGATAAFYDMGKMCKEISHGLPTFISPWIDGKKAVMAASAALSKANGVSLKEHEEEWAEIFEGIHTVIDAVAFQDGHVDYHELEPYLAVNKRLADKYGLKAWTNCETFDRDMPIKFLPIKFEKLRLKLEAARKAGYDKAITFEFSHFLSPQSMYLSAGHLYRRYKEWIGV